MEKIKQYIFKNVKYSKQSRSDALFITVCVSLFWCLISFYLYFSGYSGFNNTIERLNDLQNHKYVFLILLLPIFLLFIKSINLLAAKIVKAITESLLAFFAGFYLFASSYILMTSIDNFFNHLYQSMIVIVFFTLILFIFIFLQFVLRSFTIEAEQT